ncbi:MULTISPECIES: hypothetical protein [Sorangium]|uniref:Secreted protein n=1 Tax=Sorangium cellulosum TaxID=56 RepID=A0A4P2QT83_SORCE|nr:MULTISPECIES: hypothetical protein [Sorangium]AUX33519.1 uncharacterized protein SOCE836_056790 [Sorangium cellulosum]WCQ92835.1 hypothetical protein NQZ70_05581 [Sorangium sp. Soce836]
MGAVVMLLSFLTAGSAAAEVSEPRLWRCQQQVTVNGVPVDCSTVGGGIKLKVDDKVEVVQGDALVTSWGGELLRLGPGKAVRIPPRPAPPAAPSAVRAMQQMFQLLFGGVRQSGVMKSDKKPGAAVAAAPAPPQPRLVAPASLVVTEWKGTVRWESPTSRPLALRARSLSGALIGAPRLLDQPAVDLESLGLGDAPIVVLELLVLDSRPEGQPAYLSLPADAALRQPGRPVRAVVTTALRRAPAAERAREQQALEAELASLTPLEQAARLLAAGELCRARRAAEAAVPEGLPEPWQRSLSGVRVQVAP